MIAAAIVGAGPGGLALAAVLHRHGLAATVYERDTAPDGRAPGGPLDLHPLTGQRALREAGVFDAFRARARHAGQDLRILEPDGTVALDQVTPDDAPLVDPEIDRADLRAILLAAVPADAIAWGRRLRAARPGPAGWCLTFEDGATAHADLLVGADGARSTVRPLVTDARPAATGDVWVQTGVAVPTAAQRALVGRGNLWALGTDRSVSAQVVGDGSLRVACSFRGPAAPDVARGDGAGGAHDDARRAALVAAFDGWAAPLVALLAACDRPVAVGAVDAMPVGVRWRPRPAVTLLGDAAHLMPPVGMGANLALLDGAELGLALAAQPEDPGAAVAGYEAAMLDRAATAAAESERIARRLLSATAARDMAAMLGG